MELKAFNLKGNYPDTESQGVLDISYMYKYTWFPDIWQRGSPCTVSLQGQQK